MRFSALQKHILIHCCGQRQAKCDKESLLYFYSKKELKKTRKNQVNTVAKSIERLIDKELVIGYGTRTSRKWFIKEIKLTPKGRRQAKNLLGVQRKLPLKHNTDTMRIKCK